MALVFVWATALCALGVYAIWSEFAVGATRRGAEVVVQGSTAALFGWLQIVAGLLPAMIVLRSGRARVRWLVFCLTIGLAGAAYTLIR
ncbi:MAG: hypothetical protein ACRCV9_01190 [Burkholderiaceae bacterium]